MNIKYHGNRLSTIVHPSTLIISTTLNHYRPFRHLDPKVMHFLIRSMSLSARSLYWSAAGLSFSLSWSGVAPLINFITLGIGIDPCPHGICLTELIERISDAARFFWRCCMTAESPRVLRSAWSITVGTHKYEVRAAPNGVMFRWQPPPEPSLTFCQLSTLSMIFSVDTAPYNAFCWIASLPTFFGW